MKKNNECSTGKWITEEVESFSWIIFFKCIMYPMSIIGFILSFTAIVNHETSYGFFIILLLVISIFVGFILAYIYAPLKFKRVWVEK